MVRRLLPSTAVLAAAAVVMGACGGSSAPTTQPAAASPARSEPTSSVPSPPSPTPGSDPADAPSRRPTLHDGAPRPARLSIPALALHDLLVVPYRGWTDDAPGTGLQDRGVAASPFGPRGGVGPGGLGNYQVTGHRTSSTHPFARLPTLRPGARVVVEAGGVRYVYEIRRTRDTSFRSP